MDLSISITNQIAFAIETVDNWLNNWRVFIARKPSMCSWQVVEWRRRQESALEVNTSQCLLTRKRFSSSITGSHAFEWKFCMILLPSVGLLLTLVCSRFGSLWNIFSPFSSASEREKTWSPLNCRIDSDRVESSLMLEWIWARRECENSNNKMSMISFLFCSALTSLVNKNRNYIPPRRAAVLIPVFAE